MTQTVLITGANRGIGLEFAKQYCHAGDYVIACCRHPSQASQLNKLITETTGKIYSLDMTREDSIATFVTNLGDQPIDILINNAGIYGNSGETIGSISMVNLRRVFETNMTGVINLTQQLLPHVLAGKGKTIVTLTSQMGSIGQNQGGGSYAYRASKAAINAIMRALAIDLASQQVKVIAINPGWVKTDLGGTHAPVDVADSVSSMRKLILSCPSISKSGFFDYQGNIIPW